MTLEQRLGQGLYYVGFAADQDSGTPPEVKSYFQNLSIDITPGKLDQIATISYDVDAYNGSGRVNLIADNNPEQYQAYLIATDVYGSTYWVTKLTSHLATLAHRSLNGTWESWLLRTNSAAYVTKIFSNCYMSFLMKLCAN